MFVDVWTIFKRGIPILSWSKNYSLENAVADLVAGITIGLTLIPQVIAYASLAGLSPEYGLYSSLCGGFIYMAFGGIPELNIAPTALVSLLTFSFTHQASFGPVHAAILMCFLSGIVELLCGVLHLGFLVDFVSTPVVAAFTSAGALTIASAQVKNLLGLNFTADRFLEVWVNVFRKITQTQKWDAILGIACCVVLIFLRKLKDFSAASLQDVNRKQKTSSLKKTLWFCSVARNAFVVISCATAAFLLEQYQLTPFSLTSEVPSGLPNVTIPVTDVHIGNSTISVVDMIRELSGGIFVIPFVAILGNVAIAKAFAKGKVVDASQEMIAVGMCNLIGSFFGSYPVSASFSRAAVSNASGVRTPLAGIYTGIMVILALTFLTPYFSFIPKTTLAAVIICAVAFMVEVTLTKMIWNINKIDLVPFFITLLSCLFLGIEVGILIGVAVDIIFLLYDAARPSIKIENLTSPAGVRYTKISPTSSILFPSAEFLREKIMHKQITERECKFLVMDCQRINKIDFTSAKCLMALLSDLKNIEMQAIFYSPNAKVAKMITKVTDNTVKIIELEETLFEFLKDAPRCYSVEINVENKTSTSDTQL